MKTSILAGFFLASLALIVAPLNGQQVSADVVLRSDPVAGRSVIVHRRPPARRAVVVKRHAPRVIVVERVRHHHGKHWKRKNYRAVVVYYIDGRYYDRIERSHPRVRKIVVYERNGRYYRLDDRHDDRRDD